jgi:hypothetical protein
MDSHPAPTYPPTPTLRAVLNAAIDFGLSREEAWRSFNLALSGARLETVSEYYDVVAAELAREILGKQRRILAG